MKVRRSIFWGGAVAILLLTLIICLTKRLSTTPVDANAPTKVTESESVRSGQGETRSPAPTTASTATQNSSFSEIAPAPGRDERMREIIPLRNVPILFYGKLEDQFGNPIADAEITGNITIYNGYAGTHKVANAVSDPSGFFKLDGGSGEMLAVVPRKRGYAISSPTGGGNYSDSKKQSPDPNNPVVIKMWKLQGAEPLLQINQNYKLPFTQTPIHFDLIEGKVVPDGGDVKITVSRGEGILSGRNRQGWGLTIEAVDGGLVDSAGQDAFTYWAPEDEYRPNIPLIFSTNAPHKWSETFTGGFFIKSRNGQVYSKLGLTFSINRNPDGNMSVMFGGVANTNASRNWEGDPNTYRQQ